jgi:pimeloyl-ACP methyl ester carboxylesterase
MVLLRITREEKVIHRWTDGEWEIEYSMVGEGIPVLVFHGGHSNCHEEFGYRELLKRGYSIMTPSRAGYGGTSPLEDLQETCEAYLKLLNHLRLKKVHVIAISAGGPSGILFASLYPERVRSLTLQSAVTREWLTPADKEYKAAQILFRPSVERFTWKMIRSFNYLFPEFLFKQMAPSFSTLPYSKVRDYIREDDIDQFTKMNARQRSGKGFLIDIAQTKFISPSELQRIKCSTLVLHSKNDNAVSLEHAYHATEHIVNSKLCLVDTWGHLIWLGKGSDYMYEELFSFLRENEQGEAAI